MRNPPRECPCHSGLRYGACCRPLHEGQREADTPQALMRSRYSAFALGLGAYLVRTLTADHPDRAESDDDAARALAQVREDHRFLGLAILEEQTESDRGVVLFRARVFSRGVDRSFTERSRFRREAGAWRYEGGDIIQGYEG
jgi:SEC-C motif-containing protein